MDAGLQITVGADVQTAIRGLANLTDATAELALEGVGNITSINVALEELRKAQDEAGDLGQLQVLNRAIKDLSAEAARLKSVGVEGFDELGNKIRAIGPATQDASRGFDNLLGSTAKNRVAFVDLGRVITGEGFSLRSVASNFTLFNPLVVIAAAAIGYLAEQFLKQSDAEKKASEDAKKLKEFLIDLKDVGDITETATGSQAGNIERVRLLAAAIQDTTKTYKERNNALLELRETNKNYFGDLTLEAASLKTLSDRVSEYSKALITEAIVKGQVEEIAKVSSELEKQAHRLDELKDARDRANAAFNDAKSIPQISGGTGGVSSLTSENEAIAATKANNAFEAQRDVVLSLRTAIATYTGELQKNIAEQIKEKPLSIDPHTQDTVKGLEGILAKIKEVKSELAKKDDRPDAVKYAQSVDPDLTITYTTKISEAIIEGNKIGTADSKKYAAELASLYAQELGKIRNPNLRSIVQGIDTKDERIDPNKLSEGIEKGIDKGIKITVPVGLDLQIESISAFDQKDQEIIKKGLEKDPILAHLFVNASVEMRIAIGKTIINKADIERLRSTIRDSISNTALAGFKDVGIAIGDALSGSKNPLKKAIEDFTNVLGSGLIAIGEQMIAASALMQGLKAALGGLFANPAAGLAEGIAAIALGEIVKNVGAHAFATGGIVTGPTVGLIGEAGPEVIFPLDRLNSFVKNSQGSGSQTVRVVGSISGRNINLVQARDNKNQALV